MSHSVSLADAELERLGVNAAEKGHVEIVMDIKPNDILTATMCRRYEDMETASHILIAAAKRGDDCEAILDEFRRDIDQLIFDATMEAPKDFIERVSELRRVTVETAGDLLFDDDSILDVDHTPVYSISLKEQPEEDESRDSFELG